MNANHELERRIADFYATEAPQRAPDRVLESVLATIDTTRQRRALIRVPWRFPIMNTYAKVAIAAVAVIAVGAVGLAMFRPGTGPGVGAPGPTPSPTRLAEPGSFSAAAARCNVHLGHPWHLDLLPDRLGRHSGDGGLDIVERAQLRIPGTGPHPRPGPHGPPLPRTAVAATRRHDRRDLGDRCPRRRFGCGDARQPITVDGASGLLCSNVAAVSSGDRGYTIWLYTSDDEPWLERYYDEAWFRNTLATVTLDPSAAVVPSPSTAP